MAAVESPFRADLLKGKVALVTGGGSGIGLEITRQLALHGARVVIVGRRAAVVAASVALLCGEGLEADGTNADVRSAADAERAVAFTVQRFGALDILVNCAAGNFLALPEELSPNGFKTVMDIDAVGTFTFSRAAFPALRRPGVAGASSATSSIVNISATLHYGATWYQAHACAAKAAVDALTRALALEWGAEGVRVCGVAPGPIAGTAGMAKLAPGEGKLAELAAEVPVGRLGSAVDIAWAVVYLVSRGAGFVSGETLVVDGGAWLQRPQLVPRAAVSSASRAVEGASRKVGLPPPKPKL